MSGLIGTSHSKSKVIGRSQDTARGWVNINQSSFAVGKSFNVSSVADTSAGKWTVTWLHPFIDANYCVAAFTTNLGYGGMANTEGGAQTATTFMVLTFHNNSTGLTDSSNTHLIAFGD